MKNLIRYFLFILVLGVSPAVYAQDTGHGAANSVLNGPPPADVSAVEPVVPAGKEISASPVTVAATPFDSFEFMLSISVLFFGLVVVGFEVYLSVRQRIDPEHIMKVIILTLVITGALVLITAGYSNNQITGVTGILGSIAGYMLGKTDTKNQAGETPKTD